MKSAKLHVPAALGAVLLGLTCLSSQAYVTNLVAYNFDTDQVSGRWGGSGISVRWDPNNDASNNPASGSMLLTVNCNGSQYLLMDGSSPWYSPLPLQGAVAFTNISWDMRFDPSSAIRTNTAGAGTNGSQGVGSLDFGDMRVGTRGGSFSQDWYQYYAIPATNGAGLPNTNWIHVSVDISSLAQNFPDLNGNLNDILFGMDGGAFGNNTLNGYQYIWFDNITFSGWVGGTTPRLSIQNTIPALRMFGGAGPYGRSQLGLIDTNTGWIGGTYPVSYSFTLMDNAIIPGNLDTHVQFIPLASDSTQYEGVPAADYFAENELWLRIQSGIGTNTCVADLSWKTNAPFSFPGHTDLRITNSVRAGTWTLTFNSATTGTLTAPGAGAVAFTLSLSPAEAALNFSNPMGVRFGIMNNGVPANEGMPDDWAGISISGTAGTNFTVAFTNASTWQIDSNRWDLGASDGAEMQLTVPTNAPYWIIWNTPDTGFTLETATNLNGPWRLPEYYNSYADGTNTLATESLHGGKQWNLMLPEYLPTANGVPGGPLSPAAYFRLATIPPAP